MRQPGRTWGGARLEQHGWKCMQPGSSLIQKSLQLILIEYFTCIKITFTKANGSFYPTSFQHLYQCTPFGIVTVEGRHQEIMQYVYALMDWNLLKVENNQGGKLAQASLQSKNSLRYKAWPTWTPGDKAQQHRL